MSLKNGQMFGSFRSQVKNEHFKIDYLKFIQNSKLHKTRIQTIISVKFTFFFFILLNF